MEIEFCEAVQELQDAFRKHCNDHSIDIEYNLVDGSIRNVIARSAWKDFSSGWAARNAIGICQKSPQERSTVEPLARACRIEVYLDCGVVYGYSVSDAMKGREHADAIIRGGYRRTAEGSNDLEWYPPHRISKVKVLGGGESSRYRDTVRAT